MGATLKRKHISWKTKCASALLALGRVPYNDAKEMTEDQFLSLWHFDHNILHETGFPEVDRYWNLEPKFIREHREKTKLDVGLIAHGRRVRDAFERVLAAQQVEKKQALARLFNGPAPKLKSRGFDKRYKRKMDGTVVKR